MGRIRFFFPAFLVVIFVGWLLVRSFFTAERGEQSSGPLLDEKAPSIAFVNPLKGFFKNRETDLREAEGEDTLKLADLKTKVEDTLNASVGSWGIFVEDFKSGQKLGINEEEPFYAASLLKVPTMIAVYQEAEEGNLDFEERLIFTEEDFEGGDGSIQYEAPGTEYSIRELLTRMVKESDNVARRMITRRIGYEPIRDLFEDLGVEGYDLQNNNATARAISSIFKYLYSGSHGVVSNPPPADEKSRRDLKPTARDEMIELLTDTYHEERIPQPLPPGTKVAHKVGTWPETGSWHDCGIVFAENPYLLCLLSKNTTYEEALLVIRKISAAVYDYFTSSPDG